MIIEDISRNENARAHINSDQKSIRIFLIQCFRLVCERGKNVIITHIAMDVFAYFARITTHTRYMHTLAEYFAECLSIRDFFQDSEITCAHNQIVLRGKTLDGYFHYYRRQMLRMFEQFSL